MDGNADWHGTVPDDLVYDTTDEQFTINLDDLAKGEHVITLRASEDLDNTTYKSFDLCTSDN